MRPDAIAIGALGWGQETEPLVLFSEVPRHQLALVLQMLYVRIFRVLPSFSYLMETHAYGLLNSLK